jgi:hypothetical protein
LLAALQPPNIEVPMTTTALAALWLLLGIAVHPGGQDLPGWSVVETDHFRFHFPAEPRVDPAKFTAQEERAFEQLRGTFTGSLPGKINFYVWNTSQDGERVLGRPLGFSEPRLLLIHATGTQTPGHELTHVLLFHSIHQESTNQFITEGTAVAFDLTPRDRVALARTIMRRNGVKAVSIPELWEQPARLSAEVMYPIAGAFVERLAARGGKERLLRLLRTQTLADARTIYGAELDRIVHELETELAADVSDGRLDALRAAAQQRMRQDRDTFSADEFREIEALYQSANRDLRGAASSAALKRLIEKYPASNRAGCAVLYLAQMATGTQKEEFLTRAIARHGDARYGDGVQVGAFARAQLAALYAASGRTTEAERLAGEVQKMFPDAVDHDGSPLADALRRMKLLQ